MSKVPEAAEAPLSLAGSRTRCPYCQAMIDVPLHSRSNDPTDVYPLQTDESALLDAPLDYILVVCPVCHARMHPEASQVGKQAICPDCGTATTVCRPPEEPPKKPPRSAEEISEYPLATEARSAQKLSGGGQNDVPVVCPLCHTRMLATADQVGNTIILPDAGLRLSFRRCAAAAENRRDEGSGSSVSGCRRRRGATSPATADSPLAGRAAGTPRVREEPEIKLPSRIRCCPTGLFWTAPSLFRSIGVCGFARWSCRHGRSCRG